MFLRPRISALPLLLGACPGPQQTLDTMSPTVGVCSPMRAEDAPPRSAAELSTLVDEVRGALFPELSTASIDLVELDSETDFFQANLDLNTTSAPPFERGYRLLFNPQLFDDPPSQPAFAAILAHELTHIRDYTEMDGEELIRFGIWYATSDTAEYERETDEHALWLGCGDGLIDYRVWLYTHIPTDAVAEKERVYFTPDDIRTWQAAQEN